MPIGSDNIPPCVPYILQYVPFSNYTLGTLKGNRVLLTVPYVTVFVSISFFAQMLHYILKWEKKINSALLGITINDNGAEVVCSYGKCRE